MRTTYRIQTTQQKAEIEIDRFQRALPAGFLVERRMDGLFISLETSSEEDEKSQHLVDRELDRLFFLTGCRFRSEMCRRSIYCDLKASYCIFASLPSTIKPALWTPDLSLQLHLWAIASEAPDPIIKIFLLFQIIELSYPNNSSFPDYLDPASPPDPLTECKLLRHLIAHSGKATGAQVKAYCTYLGLPPSMLDRTSPSQVNTISNKLRLVEEQARKCLAAVA